MPDEVVRLAGSDEPAIEALLARDPIVNLFLIGFLAAHPAERTWWYGLGRPLRALVLVLPGRLAVPFAPDPADAAHLGVHLAEQHTPCLLVGPRAAADALWARWAGGARAARSHDQHLYTLRQGELAASEDPAGFRKATPADREAVAQGAAEMELEDIGVDPRLPDPSHHVAVVTDRIRAGRTWLIERDGEIVFQVNVGTSHPIGCQIGGTWVPRRLRGQGLAQAGIRATCRRLLGQHPCVTLHVNEANLAAVRVYERVGFVRTAAFRLLVP
jgi:predicted GNAT family acetyltransferase